MDHLKKVGNVSIDGTKIKANAGKHAAVSYKRADELIEQLTLEVEHLLEIAEQADRQGEGQGLSIPDEIAQGEKRIDDLQRARAVIEQRHQDKLKEQKEQYRKKKEKRADNPFSAN